MKNADCQSTVRLWLFDLDGTLVDTLPDLYAAVAEVCRMHDRPPPGLEQTRWVVSRGLRAMLELVWGPLSDPGSYGDLRQEFISYYRAHLSDHSHLMPGMTEVLEELSRRNQPWGVVTNKPAFLSHPLIDSLALATQPGVIVSGDTSSHAKPHPAPILDALSQTRAKPHEAVYIGDAETDMTAGRAAGVAVLVALWGYLAPTDHPESWHADGLLENPSALLTWPGDST